MIRRKVLTVKRINASYSAAACVMVLAMALAANLSAQQSGIGAGRDRPLTLPEKAARNGGSVREVFHPDIMFGPPFAQAVQKADVIVVGTVIETTGQMTRGEYAVFTDASVRVTKLVKGELSDIGDGGVVVFTQLGGAVDKDGLHIEYVDGDTPQLHRGESYVLLGFRTGNVLKVYSPAILRITGKVVAGGATVPVVVCTSKSSAGFASVCDKALDDVLQMATAAMASSARPN